MGYAIAGWLLFNVVLVVARMRSSGRRQERDDD